jgi:ribosomal protein L7/L12
MDLSPPSLVIGFVAGILVTLVLKRGSAPSEPAAALPPLTGELETDLRPLIEAGRKIDAIKLVRQHTGVGLKEAKEMVEDFEQRLKG